MYHIHELTSGFRHIPPGSPIALHPGDGGYAGWAQRPWTRESAPGEPDGGACPSYLGAAEPIPPAYWGQPSGLNCLASSAMCGMKGWSHHITRFMVLSNLAALLDISPRELTDWFWVAYIDAYDWVVEPNVLGLGANYIHRMSDYCEGCRFDPKRNCPFSELYWEFLERHRDGPERNPRLANMYRTLRLR